MDTNGVWGGAGNDLGNSGKMNLHSQKQSRLTSLNLTPLNMWINRTVLFCMLTMVTFFSNIPSTLAGGLVNPITQKSGEWAVYPYGWSTPVELTPSSAAEACIAYGKGHPGTIYPQWWFGVYVGTEPNKDYYATTGMLNCLFEDSRYHGISVYGSVWELSINTCPPNATPSMPCTCDAGYNPDPTRTNCVPDAPPVICPIDKFPDINDSDACTKSLEEGKGKDIKGVCEPLDPEIVKQEQCLAKKIRDLGIAYTEPSATVRTVAYQQHFVDLWEWKKVKIPEAQKKWSDAEKQECAPMVAKIEAEWGKHVLDGRPSKSGPDAPHVLRKAVDINKSIPKAMGAAVNKTTFFVPLPTYCLFCLPVYPVYIGDVQDYVNSPLVNPPACKLRWGGRFKDKYGNPDPDPVHFDLLLK